MDDVLADEATSASFTSLIKEAASLLSGSNKRIFMAKAAIEVGGQRQGEKVFGWNRATIRKGQFELKNGELPNRFGSRGRKPIEAHLPNLINDIKKIAEPSSHQDPTLQTTQIYSPLTAKFLRNELIKIGTYTEPQLPTIRTIRNKLNALNFKAEKVLKCKPRKKIKETDSIFEQVHHINAQADLQPGVLRISIDAKAAIKVGPFSRGGYSRRKNKAADHDFQPICILKLFGIFLPAFNQSYFFFTESFITPDFMIDCLEHKWPIFRELYGVRKLVINLDNGPENNSHRKQFIKRIVDFAKQHKIEIQLAYYPPYHSKYNPIERLWGILENHWRGDILDCKETVCQFARTMTYNEEHPEVIIMPGQYPKGITLEPAQMQIYEEQIHRLAGLERWFVNCNFVQQANQCDYSLN